VMRNASDVALGGCNGVRGAAVEFEGSDVDDRVVPLIRGNLFAVDGKTGWPRYEVAGR
jgi:hypothetical protein